MLKEELKKSYGARSAYAKTTALGRMNIANIFTSDVMRGLRAERCGAEGFRVVSSNGDIIKLSSAHGTLSKVCWYDEFVPAQKKRKRPDGEDTTTIRTPDGRTYFGRSGGKEHGIDVHEEVEHFIKWPQARFEAAHELADPMTREACCCIVNQGILMIDSERIAHDLVWRCGSAFDVLGLHEKTGEVVGIELKTGSDGTFTLPCRQNPRMRAPYFDDIPNTPLNRARMQLLFNCLIGERAFGVTIERAYVIHVPNSTSPAVAIDLGPIANKRALLMRAIEEWRTGQEFIKRTNQLVLWGGPSTSRPLEIPRSSTAKPKKKKIRRERSGSASKYTQSSKGF